jgi:hypothetical protein
MATQRRRGFTRWLVIGLSGLATAGFLGAIVNQAEVQQQPAVPVTVQDLSAVTTQQSVAAQQDSTVSVPANQQSQSNAQPTVRTPRFRTRGS